MSERRSSADLGANAEGLLAAFPFPERDWESDARAIEARLSEPGSTDELLFAAPLPSEPDEPSAISATATPLSNSGVRTQSLAELARRSVEKKQAGEREMARASFAIAAGQRPSAEQARALSEALTARATAAAPPPPLSTALESARPPPVAPAAIGGGVSASPWPKLALGAPLLALAAAALLWLRRPAEPTPLVVNALPTATSEARPNAATASPLRTTGEAPSGPRGIDPSALPGEAPAKPLEVAHARAAAASSEASPASGARARPSAEKIALEDERPAAVAAAPSEKAVEKALPPDPALRPADSSSGEIPVRPSTGAVQAALGAVLSGARHCVAGDDAPSSAVVLFGSDGHVQNVAVNGPAAGKASGACIQAQLAKARVQPFAAANFSVNATIRPD